MNRKQVQADIRQYIEFSYDRDIPALEQELLAKGYSHSQIDIIREAKTAIDEWCNFTSEYDFNSINSEVNNMIEKTTEKVIGKVIIPVSVSSIAEVKKPTVKATSVPAVKDTSVPATKTAPVVSQKPAKATPVPATKATPAEATGNASGEVKKRIKAESNGDAKVKLLAGSSSSSIGKFIVNKISGNPDITCNQLADAIVNDFVTKKGIKPDIKWAVRNIKLFIEKGVIKAE